MRVIRILAFLVIAATIGFAAGCGDDDDEDTAAIEATTEEAAAAGGGATEVSMTEYAFHPADATVPQGERWLTATNDGQIPHNYSIKGGQKEIGATTGDVDPGSSRNLRPRPVDVSPATYDVICTIPGHAKKGMKGTLTIK